MAGRRRKRNSQGRRANRRCERLASLAREDPLALERELASLQEADMREMRRIAQKEIGREVAYDVVRRRKRDYLRIAELTGSDVADEILAEAEKELLDVYVDVVGAVLRRRMSLGRRRRPKAEHRK